MFTSKHWLDWHMAIEKYLNFLVSKGWALVLLPYLDLKTGQGKMEEMLYKEKMVELGMVVKESNLEY